MRLANALRSLGLCTALATLATLPAQRADAQAWDAVKYFQYNVENVTVVPDVFVPGSYRVRVIYSVTEPATGIAWDVQAVGGPFRPAAPATGSLTLDIGWDPSSDFANTGSEPTGLAALTSTDLGKAAALVVQVRNLPTTGSQRCSGAVDCPGISNYTNRFWVEKAVAPIPFGKPRVTHGRVALEGRPVCNFAAPECVAAPTAIVPVTSATIDFAFQPANPQAAIVPNPRRQVVDIAKCKGCHDGGQHGDTIVPMLSLHGGNRNQNLNLCVMCHNANQTDVPYRYLAVDPLISGPETAVDFKTMVHSIHSGGFRETPFVVIGRNSSINDYSDVRFPSRLRNCLNCHVENGGKGSYELPISASALGTTTATGSVYKVSPGAWRSIDVNPANDVKTSPTAAVCSSCHDKAEVRSHMTRRGGASFSTTQSAIGVTVRERCANCHGPGKEKDVKKVHEVGRSGSSDEHDD